MYGIMNIQKRKLQAVGGLQREANRTRSDGERGVRFVASDIDWTRTRENGFFVHSDDWRADIKQMTEGLRVRKDAVVLLDALYTASPEYLATLSRKEQIDYFRECLQFHIDEYCQGDASRVINAVVHYDETTPHMQIASVPIFEEDGRRALSAKRIMGNREAMRDHQDAFHDRVCRLRGLDRGHRTRTAGEKRQHLDTLEYKALKTQEALKTAYSALESIKRTPPDIETIQGHQRKALGGRTSLPSEEMDKVLQMSAQVERARDADRLTNEVRELKRALNEERAHSRALQNEYEKLYEYHQNALDEIDSLTEEREQLRSAERNHLARS